MSTSALGTVLDALVDAWVARPGLSGVNIFSAPVSYEEAGEECVALGDARLDEEAMAMSGDRWEVWRVEGEMRIAAKSWQGAGGATTEKTIRAARNRALAILVELETYLNDTYTGSLPDVELTAGQLTQLFNTEGRVCWLAFTLTVKNGKNP